MNPDAVETLGQRGTVLRAVSRGLAAELGSGQEFNDLYRSYFGNEVPVRTRVQVAALSQGVHIEIEAIAALP